MLPELNIDELRALQHEDLALLALRYQAELRTAQVRLALARVIIADTQASIKRKSHALRNVQAKRRSLTQTVIRRRKHAK